MIWSISNIAVTLQRCRDSDMFWSHLFCIHNLCDESTWMPTFPSMCRLCKQSACLPDWLWGPKYISMWSVCPSANQWRGFNVCASLTQSAKHLHSEISKASEVCCWRQQNAEFLLWFMMWADPDRVGDGLTGRQASLVSTPNPRCFIHTSSPALPVPPTTTHAHRCSWQEATA